MNCSKACLFICVILMRESIAEPPSKSQWIQDDHGCLIYNPNSSPRAGESVRSSGPCKNGYGDGYKFLEWFDSAGAADGWMKGEFVHGYLQGAGEFQTAKGTYYRGNFLNSLDDGHGTLVFSDGTRYTGEFVQGHFNGHGTTEWPNGTRYEGDFEHDKRSGYGVVSVRSGARFEGRFKNDEADGRGTIIWSDGTRVDVEVQRVTCGKEATERSPGAKAPSCQGSHENACKDGSMIISMVSNNAVQDQADVGVHSPSLFVAAAAMALAVSPLSVCAG
jgi:hypothetical protein